MIKCKIDEYTISLNQSVRKIYVQHLATQPKEYLISTFERDGMRMFPKKLYQLICGELKYANIYDKFLDRFYTWEEKEETS